jgi:ribosomal protein S18 acetylase RimI-like enzyme
MSRNRQIEEASLNAWPALNVLLYDGWIMRFANGYTKRANSITPLYQGELDVDSKIDFCAQQFRQQGLRPIFRLAQVNNIGEMDTRLAARAYEKLDLTSVQGRPLPGEFELAAGVDVFDLTTWLQIFHELNPGRGDLHTHQAILERVLGRLCPMVLSDGADKVACGLGVLQGAYLGLFDIVTRESVRRKGYGRQLTKSLLAWGQEQSAVYAYLQVMLNNKPAQALYQQLGFSEQYQYWYRIALNQPTEMLKY